MKSASLLQRCELASSSDDKSGEDKVHAEGLEEEEEDAEAEPASAKPKGRGRGKGSKPRKEGEPEVLKKPASNKSRKKSKKEDEYDEMFADMMDHPGDDDDQGDYEDEEDGTAEKKKKKKKSEGKGEKTEKKKKDLFFFVPFMVFGCNLSICLFQGLVESLCHSDCCRMTATPRKRARLRGSASVMEQKMKSPWTQAKYMRRR